jgi:S-adenosylmethionine synthetase
MIQDLARKAIKDIGYEQDGFHWANANIEVLLHGQSADIAQGVDAKQPTNQEEGAGDQGIMFGYACNETPELMPAPIYYATRFWPTSPAPQSQEGRCGLLGPDSKSQVTVRYENGKPVGVTPSSSRTSTSSKDCRRPRFATSSSPTCARRCPKAGSARIRSGTSTRPASSTSAVPMATAG